MIIYLLVSIIIYFFIHTHTSNKKIKTFLVLSSVSIPEAPAKRPTPKDRCKYFPVCRSGESCEFYHPTKDCKLFPSCKFGDNCAYLHPMCKFDTSCTRSDCNYMHTPILAPTTPPANSGTLPPLGE